ncbi:hypothetical protein NKH18_47730 [Streptomyces sp. M10(2022)]
MPETVAVQPFSARIVERLSVGATSRRERVIHSLDGLEDPVHPDTLATTGACLWRRLQQQVPDGLDAVDYLLGLDAGGILPTVSSPAPPTCRTRSPGNCTSLSTARSASANPTRCAPTYSPTASHPDSGWSWWTTRSQPAGPWPTSPAVSARQARSRWLRSVWWRTPRAGPATCSPASICHSSPSPRSRARRDGGRFGGDPVPPRFTGHPSRGRPHHSARVRPGQPPRGRPLPFPASAELVDRLNGCGEIEVAFEGSSATPSSASRRSARSSTGCARVRFAWPFGREARTRG